jgi:hypothetical protein
LTESQVIGPRRNLSFFYLSAGCSCAPKHRGEKRKPRPWRSRQRHYGGGGPTTVPATSILQVTSPRLQSAARDLRRSIHTRLNRWRSVSGSNGWTHTVRTRWRDRLVDLRPDRAAKRDQQRDVGCDPFCCSGAGRRFGSAGDRPARCG